MGGFLIALSFSIVAGFIGGVAGYFLPEAAAKVVDTTAAVSAILVGVSIAVVAILASPHSGGSGINARGRDMLRENDLALADQQLFMFLGFFVSLTTGLLLKFVVLVPGPNWTSRYICGLSALFLGSVAYSLSLALYMPWLLRAIIKARKTF